jgi:hypothetical protein
MTTIDGLAAGSRRSTRGDGGIAMCMPWAWLLAVACAQPAAAEPGPPPPSPPSAPSPPATRFEHDMMVRFHMHENLGLLRAIEKLLIRGRLDDAQQLARAISDAPDEPGMGSWATYATVARRQLDLASDDNYISPS